MDGLRRRWEAEVRQRLTEDDTVATAHLSLYGIAGRLERVEPDEVEGVLLGSAVAGDRDREDERHRVLARVVVRRDPRRRKVLGDTERHRRRWQLRKCDRTEVFLDVPVQGVADALVKQHPAGDHFTVDIALGRGSEK